jgi:hypothetical protein
LLSEALDYGRVQAPDLIDELAGRRRAPEMVHGDADLVGYLLLQSKAWVLFAASDQLGQVSFIAPDGLCNLARSAPKRPYPLPYVQGRRDRLPASTRICGLLGHAQDSRKAGVHVYFLPAKKCLTVELCWWQSHDTMDAIQLLADHIARNEASQAQFARNVSCSEPHLSLILARKRGLSVPLAKRISDKTGIPVRELVPEKVEKATEVLEAAQ